MKFKFYEYEKCSTCKKARNWMDSRGIIYERIPIREQTPTKKELLELLEGHQGKVKKLFNTSSKDYRDPKIKDSLPGLSQDDMINLLTARGNLIKRPILIGKNIALQGFNSEEWGKLDLVESEICG